MLFGTATTLLVYWTAVCPELYRYGARFPTGLLLYRWKRDLRRYRHLLKAQARPLSWYYFLLVLTWFTLGIATVAIALLLAQMLTIR